MTTSNDTRAERAQNALQAYVEAKGEVFENSGSEISDLIADLLHLAVKIEDADNGPETVLRLARMHFNAEHGNPEEEEEAKPELAAAYFGEDHREPPFDPSQREPL